MSGDFPGARDGHPALPGLARAFAGKRITRREFLACATAFGLAAPLARALAGLPAQAATAETPVSGGRIRIAMPVMEVSDPRLFDWPQKSNLVRGMLETLVRYEEDGVLTPWLLEGWETNADATEHLLRLRPGVFWSNGDPFGTDDVTANFARWSEAHVPGNSMATRIASLIETKRTETRRVLVLRGQREVEDEIEVAVTGLIPGAVERIDDLTLRLRAARPDITLIPGLSDYPALIVHRDFDRDGADLTRAAVGTGPWVLDRVVVGERAALNRRWDTHGWWGDAVHGPAPLDGIDFVDRGPDPARDLSAFADGVIDANYESTPAYVRDFDAAGLIRAEARTANTVCARMNRAAPPYDSQAVRVAVQRAVDNAVVLELGQQGYGILGENHHVAPMDPDYAPLPPLAPDPQGALAALTEAGVATAVFELVSSDADVPRNTCDAIAAQLRDAGLDGRRAVLPSEAFWRNWRDHPFSATEWVARPLAIQTYALAYRSGAPWNETGFADPAFDALLDRALGLTSSDDRRPLMAEMERILRDSGVLIQAFWRDIFRHMTPRVHGLRVHPAFELHLEKVWLSPESP